MNDYQDNYNNESKSGTFQKSLLELVVHNRKLIITTISVTLVLTLVYLLAATPIYTSKARICVEQAGPKFMSDYDGFMTGSKNYLYTQKELLTSPSIISEVTNDHHFKKFDTFKNVDNKIKFLEKKLAVEVGKKDDIITISLDSPYAQEASEIVNAVVSSYVNHQTTHRKSTVLEVLKILQKEKAKSDLQMKLQVDQMLSYTKDNQIIYMDDKSGSNVEFQRLSKLSEALTQAELDTINAKANYEAVVTLSADPLKVRQMAMAEPYFSASAIERDNEIKIEAELRQHRAELEKLKNNCTDSHPSVIALQEQVFEIEQQRADKLVAFAGSYIEIMKQKYLSQKQTEEQLYESYQAQQGRAQEIGLKNAQYSVLLSEMKRTERLCEVLDERIKNLNVAEDTGALNINIIEVAKAEDKASKPEKAKTMAMALLFGMMLSSGLVLLREHFDCTLKSTEEISEVLSVPVLGVVPKISEELNVQVSFRKTLKSVRELISYSAQMLFFVLKGKSGKAYRNKLRKSLNTSAGNAWNEIKSWAISLLPQSIQPQHSPVDALSAEDKKQMYHIRGQRVHVEPKSVAAESYRTIRTAVFFGVPEGQAKSILVTSPTPGDGKSTLASNLSLAMAQAGQKTLLLDCDFRKPMQHNIFDVDSKIGISDVISGNVTLSQAIQQSPVENLSVMASGTEVPNPSELLNSNSFGEFLDKLTEKYDRIIIDSPPVVPVADAKILGAQCDVTILVLRAEKSTRKVSQIAAESLISVGAHLLGTVVNDVTQKHGHYGYYSRYGYYNYGHSYGYDNNKKESQNKQSKKSDKSKAYV